MAGALELFNSMPQSKVKNLTMEFATLGIAGIDPKKDGNSIPSIQNKTFSGSMALAYYYVSWAIAMSEVLGQLQMPFDKEYELAKKLTDL